MGKDEYLQAIQVLAPRFRFFGTFIPDNENAGGSAICINKDILPEGAVVSHVIACQGRGHLLNTQCGRHNLVIFNVHFEPELSLRQLRGRLCLIHPHWPANPNGVGIILGWKLVEDCFDTSSFECVDFWRLGQIIANLIRETLAKREAEFTNLPWMQTEKDTALARCRGGQRAWRNKKLVLSQCCHR